jgi:ADP-ribosyl-[dinitrogen reductase] hydrolase
MQGAEDRAAGVLIGLAAGDRIGGPVRMALRFAQSLVERDGFDISDVGERYVSWWLEGAFDSGPTAAGVLSKVASGSSFEEASIEINREVDGLTAGCNPAHRCAPLSMCSGIKDTQIGVLAQEEAKLTHRHPLAGDVAAAVACLCRALIRGKSWQSSIKLSSADKRPETRQALSILSPEALSKSGFAPDVLGAAIYFVNCSKSFADALNQSIDFAGSANYCPVLVGSIAGARWGKSQIDNSALHHHGDLVPRIKGTATALSRRWALGENNKSTHAF